MAAGTERSNLQALAARRHSLHRKVRRYFFCFFPFLVIHWPKVSRSTP